ncbi:MAG: DUF1295 domain-containing protein [Stackebrandtia sp.]
MPWTAVLVNLGVCGAAALAVMLIAFAVGAATGRHRVVDEAWGLAFAAIAVTTLVLSWGHGDAWPRWLVAAATLVWGLRLFVHIHRRARGTGEDPRYERMLSKAEGPRIRYAFSHVYLLQAAVAWFVSLPVQLAAYQTDAAPGWLIAGGAVWLLGFGFEAIGDAQLAAFRRDPARAGGVLDTGLWRYTRHPNYFGDACVWWGLYLMGSGSVAGALTVLSPVAMTYFLVAKTGKPLMERHMSDSRPGYAEYMRRTSGFLPLPPRR